MPEPQQLMNLSRFSNGRFTGAQTPDRTKGSLRETLKRVLEEPPDLDQEPETKREAVARALYTRAITGNPEAIKLAFEQHDGPLGREDNRGDWQVTINYVHQQAIVQAPDNQLAAPDD